MLMDTQHIHFSLRHLYVGASRVTSGEYLHIANRSVARYIEEQTEAVPHEEVVEPDRPQEEQLEGMCAVEGMDDCVKARLSGEGILLHEAIDE